MTDPTLFDPDAPRARNTDPATSHEAAASVTGRARVQRAVLEALELGPATDLEVARRVRRAHPGRTFSDSGLRTRRSELVDLGAVRDSGRTKRLPSGRRAIVWTR